MKLASLWLLAAAAVSVCAAKGCPEDALRCADGTVLSRDVDHHCQFPECPEDKHTKHPTKEHEEKLRSKTFTFSDAHL